MDTDYKGTKQSRWMLHLHAKNGNERVMEKVRNEALYGNLPRVTDKIRERRLRLAGHCVRHSELEVSDLVLWEPTQGKSSRGSQRLTYVDMLI